MRKQFKCGTPLIQELNSSVKAFHEGKPLSDRVVVDEVIMNVHNDWSEVGTLISDGEEKTIFTPQVDIENENANTRLLSPDDIKGFVPLRGHEYRLRARRFKFALAPFHCRYELIEVLYDHQSSLPLSNN